MAGHDAHPVFLGWCPANNFHLTPDQLGARVAQRGAARDGLPGLGPAMTHSVGVMPGLDPGIHAERKIDAERKLVQGTPN